MELTIDPRFNGPPASGHGGYVAGAVASFLEGPSRVRLHRPPPLGRGLEVRRSDGAVTLLDGDAVVATAAPAAVELSLPDLVGFDEAAVASREYPGFGQHVFSRCFACGPARAPGDGLRIFPGPVAGRGVVAAPWVPDASLTGGSREVRPEFLWAALDCPSGWAATDVVGRPSVLGELAARLTAPVFPGERCVVLGWALGGGEGRKRFAASAILGEDGAPRAVARSTWITLARD